MAERRPLVLVSGREKELPQGDSLVGGQVISGPIQFSSDATISPPALTGDVDDYSPTGFSDAALVRIDPGAADRDITGLLAPSPPVAAVKYIQNISNEKKFSLRNNDAGSLAVNRFLFKANLDVEKNEALILIYDPVSLRWRVANLI